jgi:hypothetical protein
MFTRVIGATSADGVFWDNHLPFASKEMTSIVWLSDNVGYPNTNAAMAQSVRDGWAAGINRYKALTSKKILTNCGNWAINFLTGAIPGSAINDFNAFQLDGGLVEQPFGRSNSPFGVYPSGTSILTGTGNFELGRSRVQHAMWNQTNFRANPGRNMWMCNMMSRANLDAAGKAAGYAYLRYMWTACFCLTNHAFGAAPLANGVTGEYKAWDDYDIDYGAGGLTEAQKFANRQWMGLALQAARRTPTEQGVYSRDFANAYLWCNPKGNGGKTVTMPAAGAGKKWVFIAGTQDPAVDTGADVGATIFVPEGDGRILKRVNI